MNTPITAPFAFCYRFLLWGAVPMWKIPRCPHCGRKHTHGEPPDLTDLLRRAHCGMGEPGSYVLTLCSSRQEAITRQRAAERVDK